MYQLDDQNRAYFQLKGVLAFRPLRNHRVQCLGTFGQQAAQEQPTEAHTDGHERIPCHHHRGAHTSLAGFPSRALSYRHALFLHSSHTTNHG